MIPIEAFLTLGTIVFAIGLYGVIVRRNAVLILLSIEVMLNAVNINFIAFAAYAPNQFLGQVFTIFVICVAAAEVGLGLGILLRLYRNRSTVNVDTITNLRW